ncbi:hypothetical protein OV203_01475 [Nannocystis sp. ILAH1]|uniref:hypothetical protein n=1 Tax=Nannocystis sp. ILAH1 TaxID=2996789 RepID=UPI0022715984|nr:hypothetical protein [Nannocystis sp. ILAH1]MCY0985781.1 hypothetical protein [Nannocystis sp. ILAH1]
MTTPSPLERRLASLASSFPSLKNAPLSPWSGDVFRTWADAQPEKTAAWWAARFVLAFGMAKRLGWVAKKRPAGAVVRYGFDIFEARAAWTEGDRRAAAIWLLTAGETVPAIQPVVMRCSCEPPVMITVDLVRLSRSPIVCHRCECPFIPEAAHS